MKTYVALLRGINVGGHKKLNMTELKILFEELDFSNVKTYIQSGNVVFDSKFADVKNIENNIHKGIDDKYGFKVPVILRTADELSKIIKNSPFLRRETEKLYVTFLAELPLPVQTKKLEELDFSHEEFVVDGKTIYLFYPNGSGKSKMSTNLFENKLKVAATSRNWKTVNTLFKMTQ